MPFRIICGIIYFERAAAISFSAAATLRRAALGAHAGAGSRDAGAGDDSRGVPAMPSAGW